MPTTESGQLPLGSSQTSTTKRPPPVAEPERRAPTVEVLEPQALTRLGISSPAEIDDEISLIDRLTALDDAAVLFDRRAALIEQARRSAIRNTNPDDWVLFKDRDGNVTGMLCRSGADKVADYYGIQIFNFRPLNREGIFEPKVEKKESETRYYGWCDAYSQVTGRKVESIEFGRSSSEGFTGRGGISSTSDMVKAADLRAATFTNARTKAVRIICSMSRVPASELTQAWTDDDTKSIDACRKGSGFGTSTERGADRVTSGDVKAEAKKLGDEILARVGGDTDAAKKLLIEITENRSDDPKKDFKGFDSVARLTKDWQVSNAWKRLREHSVFGDSSQGAE